MSQDRLALFLDPAALGDVHQSADDLDHPAVRVLDRPGQDVQDALRPVGEHEAPVGLIPHPRAR